MTYRSQLANVHSHVAHNTQRLATTIDGYSFILDCAIWAEIFVLLECFETHTARYTGFVLILEHRSKSSIILFKICFREKTRFLVLFQ